MLSGFINLYKHRGITSNKALSILKWQLKENNINTKVGHFGTLDPMAEGVLPVALGRATRLFNYFLDKKKEYIAEFKFGIETDTLDSQGKELLRNNKTVTISYLEAALPKFIGQIAQLPPKFSAKNIDGKRAYELARKGIEFQLNPKNIIIYDIKLIEQVGENTFIFKIICSGGTYIRSIVRDIAYTLNTVGILTALKRTASGAFTIENSVNMQTLENTDINSYILPMDTILTDYDSYQITIEQKMSLLNGIKKPYQGLPEGYFKVYSQGNFIGIGKADYHQKLEIKTWLI